MSTRKLTIAEAEYQGLTVKGLGAATTDVLIITVGVVAALGIWAMTRPCKKETQK